jgi:hypothetical protein
VRKDAKAWPWGGNRDAGAVAPANGKSSANRVLSSAGAGSGAPAARRFASLFGLIALLALGLGALAAPASATYLHANDTQIAFGPDGTNDITGENSFYGQTIADIAVDSVRHRLYVAHERDPADFDNRIPYPGAPRGLYAYDISDPSHPQPLGGKFPVAIPEQAKEFDELAVDPDDGSIYMLERAEICFCEPGGTLYSWDPEGKPRPGYPTHIDKYGPLAIDPEGYLWVWREQNSFGNEKLKKYLPDGTLVGELHPDINGIPHDLTFNRDSGDLWLEYAHEYVRFTADSGYTYHDSPLLAPNFIKESGFAVDSTNGVLYSVPGTGIEATNEQGGVVEGPFGIGPESSFASMALDESTGDIWVVNEGRWHGTNTQEERAKGGRLEAFFGIGASDVHTGPAIDSGKTDATVTARIGPGEGPPVTACQIEYVTDEAFQYAQYQVNWEGSAVECEPAPSDGSPFGAPTEVQAHLTGLAPGATYHYRAVATSAAGTVYGGEESFDTTFSAVQTGPATEVDRDGATLNGTVDPEGLSTTYYFEYGSTPAYGSTTAVPPGDDLGTTTPGQQPVSEAISGLEPGRTYHYRLIAVNSNGTSKGVDRTFTTTAAVLGVESGPATEVQRNQAMLHGTLDPGGLETHYYFEWGTSRRYGETSATPPGEDLSDTSSGQKQLSFLATGLTSGVKYHFRLVATNSFGTTFGNDQTFTTQVPIKDVATEPATGITTEEATLSAKLDPDGIATTFYFEYGKTNGYGQIAPLPPGESVGDSTPGPKFVSYTLQGLEPGVTYHYRVVAVNPTGETAGGDRSFTTTHAPTIEGVSSKNVTASSAELEGRINPFGFETEWYFEYGRTIELGSVVPVPHGSLPGETTGQSVSATLTGLEDATYFFRLVAKSEWGTVLSEIQTFEFAPPSCPNAALRQQTGANYLPDCRAYELVTPGRAGGSPIFPIAPFSGVANDHVGFSSIFNVVPGTNPPNAGTGFGHADFYVASRDTSGWHTHYVGVLGNETLESKEILWKAWEGSAGIPGDERLEHFLTWENRFPCCGDNGSYSPYMYDAEGNLLHRLPTNADQEDLTLGASAGGFRGDGVLSGDGKHYLFSSVRKAFTADGLTVAPGSAYDDNIETGEVTKISYNEAGDDLESDPLASDSGVTGEFIKIKEVSSDASHVLMTLAGPNDAGACGTECKEADETVHLYMHVRDHGAYDVSSDYNGEDRPVHYGGIANDGSEVFFSTTYPMTEDDSDQSSDLYRWNESTNELTRLSSGAGNTGNSDACPGSWTAHCGVEVVPSSHSCLKPEIREARACGDSVVARNTGEIYFYSPEQLDGARGVAGNRNLYVYRDGQPRLVTSLPPARPAERMNVTWDGNFMAFLTKSRITAYDNAGFSQMYKYDAQSRSLTCVSCRPDGDPPTADTRASFNGYFLTNDGRAFFSTQEALVDRDANGVSDTYEYVDGRPQLISNGADAGNGTNLAPIGLIGVTLDGQNVLFGTYQTLVGQDENGLFYKIYDARANGGFPFQRPAAPCAAADECHGEGNATPAPPVIGSSANLGQRGNYTRAGKKRARHRKKHRRHAHHRKHKHQKARQGSGGRKGAGR